MEEINGHSIILVLDYIKRNIEDKKFEKTGVNQGSSPIRKNELQYKNGRLSRGNFRVGGIKRICHHT